MSPGGTTDVCRPHAVHSKDQTRPSSHWSCDRLHRHRQQWLRCQNPVQPKACLLGFRRPCSPAACLGRLLLCPLQQWLQCARPCWYPLAACCHRPAVASCGTPGRRWSTHEADAPAKHLPGPLEKAVREVFFQISTLWPLYHQNVWTDGAVHTPPSLTHHEPEAPLLDQLEDLQLLVVAKALESDVVERDEGPAHTRMEEMA